MDQQYFTTPIYYVNGDPHIGHAHTSIMGDILKRFSLMHGDRAFYSTGTDEHGQKNQESIEKSGLSADAYLTQQSEQFRKLFHRLNVDYDFYVRTTHPSHKSVVSNFLLALYEKGLIYKKEYSGLYCVGCEQFKKVSDLNEAGHCPDHQKAPVLQTETNYFLKLHPFQEWLINTIRSNDDLIQPEFYRKEILGLLTDPLEDLCISRPKSRVWLGIELPFDADYVAYVWFDALLNYISNIGYGQNPEFDAYWKQVTHLMAKDIIKTHMIYWPIMLYAAGLPAPFRYRVHGYWIGEGGQKMAKSLGNVVEPNQLLDRVGTDALRFYLTKTMGGNDAQISESLVIACYNIDLANNIGNLHSRVLKFAKKTCNNTVPSPASLSNEDRSLQAFVVQVINREFDSIDMVRFPELIKSALEVADRLNQYYNDTAPWLMVKDENQRDRVQSVLYVMLDCLGLLFRFLYPVIPGTANNALRSLGLDPIPAGPHRQVFASDQLPKGSVLGDAITLFPRLDQ